MVRVPLAIEERTYTIAKVAERTEVTAHTLRYNEPERLALLEHHCDEVKAHLAIYGGSSAP